jgi:hypothetical protein
MRKVILADCPNGRIVRLGNRWGVVCKGRYTRGHEFVVDFWDGGREYVKAWKVVEVQA